MTPHALPTVYLARHGETAWSKSGSTPAGPTFR
jgi:broad specificity phosphatase PhoE